MIDKNNFYVKNAIRALKEYNFYPKCMKYISLVSDVLPHTFLTSLLLIDPIKSECNRFYISLIIDRYIEDILFIFNNDFPSAKCNVNLLKKAISNYHFYAFISSTSVNVDVFEERLFERCYGVKMYDVLSKEWMVGKEFPF